MYTPQPFQLLRIGLKKTAIIKTEIKTNILDFQKLIASQKWHSITQGRELFQGVQERRLSTKGLEEELKYP